MLPLSIFAHRGYSSRYPENTLRAFRAAMALGVQGIEFDVRLSKDGHVVVIHDPTLDRVTNTHGSVRDLTLKELQTLDAGSWFHLRFAGERIPTLEQVLELRRVMHSKAILNIELKSDDTDPVKLSYEVRRIVDKFRMQPHVLYSSFHHETIYRLKMTYQDAHVALLYDEGDGVVDMDAVASARVEAIHPHYSSVTTELIAAARQCNLHVNTYTVNRKQDMSSMMSLGVNAIITDRPCKAFELHRLHMS